MMATLPAPAVALLDFIASKEAPRGYGTIYGNNQHRLARPITAMTLDELIAAQAGFTARYGSSASGRYQFMRATLRGLKAELGLAGSTPFSPDLQDRLGYHLLRRRGYDDFVAARISRTEFGRRLAQEWASLPVLQATAGANRRVARGQSYYAGDGRNKALVAAAEVEQVLDAVLAARGAPAGGNADLPEPAPRDASWIVRLARAILDALKGADR